MLKADHHSQSLPCTIFHKQLTIEKAVNTIVNTKNCPYTLTSCYLVCFALFLSKFTQMHHHPVWGAQPCLQWFLWWFLHSSRLELIKSSTRQSPTTSLPELCFQQPEQLCVSLAGTACCSSYHTSSLMLISYLCIFSRLTTPSSLGSSFSTHAPSH